MITVAIRSKDPAFPIEDFPEKHRWLIESGYPAPSEYWVLKRGNARATVGAAVSPTHPERGYVGFFECLPFDRELAGEALRLASEWLNRADCQAAYGPVNLSTWFTYRYKLPSADPHAFFFEPLAPSEYREAFAEAGFVNDSLFLSEAIESYATLEKYVKPIYERALASGYQIENARPATFVTEVLPALYPICMKAFAANYLFEPISREGFLALYGGLAHFVDLRHSQLLYDPAGTLIGFSLWVAERRHLMLKTIAVDPAYQGKGLSNAMVYPAIQSAKGEVDHFAGVMFKADNVSASYSKHGTLIWRHEYVLYRKDFA